MDYKKKQSKFSSQQTKAEQKHTTRDPAVAQKLQQVRDLVCSLSSSA
jgi:hypothetical protein